MGPCLIYLSFTQEIDADRSDWPWSNLLSLILNMSLGVGTGESSSGMIYPDPYWAGTISFPTIKLQCVFNSIPVIQAMECEVAEKMALNRVK